jgi:hypothetical protein
MLLRRVMLDSLRRHPHASIFAHNPRHVNDLLMDRMGFIGFPLNHDGDPPYWFMPNEKLIEGLKAMKAIGEDHRPLIDLPGHPVCA